MDKEFLAKPKGTSLKEHTKNVMNEAQSIIQSHSLVFNKYMLLTGKSLEKRLIAAACYHDDGKKSFKWQEACQKEHQTYLETGRVNGAYLRKTGIRHEMHSLYLHRNSKFLDVLKVAIAAHHGKLGKKYEERWEKDSSGVYKAFWDEFQKLN